MVQREDDTEDGHPAPARALRAPDGPADRVVPAPRPLSSVNGTGSPDAVTRRASRPRRPAVQPRPVESSANRGPSAPTRTSEPSGPVSRRGRVRRNHRRAGQDAPGRPGRRRDAREDHAGRIRPGVTTAEIDAVARQVLERRGATSNFLGYHGFPAVICTSPNDMIVHGIPGDYRLEEGDILSIDCGAIVEGYHGDAAYTMRRSARSRPRRPGSSRSPSEACGPGSSSSGPATGCTRSGGPSRTSPRRPASPSSGSTSATPSAPPCTSSPRSRTTGPAAPARRSRPAWSSPSSRW